MMTRLCIVRHGETEWNAGRRIQGQIDIPLSGAGVAQARAAANYLCDEDFAAIYSSDLARARQTAQAVAHLSRLPLQTMAGLRERHFGVFQGMTHEEAQQQRPQEFARHLSREPRFAPPGGESLLQLAARVATTFADIINRHRGEAAAVFTHGGVLDILYRQATGRALAAPRDFVIPNAAVNWFTVADGCWMLSEWAQREHLTNMAACG